MCLLYNPNKAARSRTIPIKIRLCSASGANYSSAATAVTADGLWTSTSVSGTAIRAGTANLGGTFRFDRTLGPGYVFNVRMTGLPAGTYHLRIRITSDPQPHVLQFAVR